CIHGIVAVWKDVQARVHRWFGWPVQVQRMTCAPLAVPARSTSRQRPEPVLRIEPSWPMAHFWLSWPVHDRLSTWAPLAEPSRHLSPKTRISPFAQLVHSWLAAVWQSQISVPAPEAVEALSTSRHRP